MMKKLFVMGCLLGLTLAATADDQTKIDASKVQRITFQGDQVVVKYNDGTPDATLDMDSVVIRFSSTTSIEERSAIVKQAGLQGKKVYDLKGHLVSTDTARLKQGVYVIEGKKVVIK